LKDRVAIYETQLAREITRTSYTSSTGLTKLLPLMALAVPEVGFTSFLPFYNRDLNVHLILQQSQLNLKIEMSS
jgi:hypothetical protein